MRIVPQTHNGGWNDIYPNDATFRLELIISQPPDNHYLVTKIIDNLHFQEWHNVSLTFKFTDNPTVDVIVGTKLSTYDFSDTIPDLDCWKSNLLENPLRFGADHTNTTMWSDSGDCDLPGYDRDVRCRPVIETYFSSIEILSPIPAGNPNTVNSALYLLKENLYNNISLSYNQKNSLVEQFIKNWDGNWNANSASVINFINAYSETKSAIFDLVSVDSPAWTPSAGSKSFVYDVVNSTASWEYESSHERYVAYLLQVWIHMYLFEEPFFSEAEGIAYKDAEEFPGIVKEGAPRIDSTNVTIRGTYLTDPGRSFGDDGRLIQPTGLWAPAGELVTIKVDSNVAGQGLEAWVGAHHFDLKGSTDIEASASSYARFPVISKKFGILNNETIIASPFGGAIYIEVPAGSDLGLINITIEDAVRGSLFSTRYFNETNLDDWNQSITQADTPWVDIISDKFMVSLPTPFVNFTKQLYCKISPQDADQDCTFNSQSDNLTIHITRDNCLSGSLIIEYPNGSNEEFSCTIDPDDEDHMQLQFPVLGNDGASSIHIEQQGTYTITSNIVYEYEEDGSAVGGTIIAAHLDRNTPLDPTEILRLWDLTADAFLIAGGWPVERGDALQHLWILPDLQSHPGTMAPAANPMSMGTEVSQSQAYGKFSEGVTDLQLIDNFDDEWWNPLTVTRHQYTSPNPEIGIVYHEWGHMHNYPTLWSEVENIANFPGLVIFSHAFNYSLDDSLKFSTFQELDRNESINNWMITSNFREGQRIGEGYAGYTDEGYPLDHVSYQSRGLGRYIDLAYLFGWEGVGSIHNQYYQRIITANAVPDVDYNLPSTNLWGTQSGILEASNPSDADFIISSSNALGWNMAPFFDFWGIIPDANTISYLSDVPVSPHVQNLLLQHRTIVLRNNSDFVDYYNSISDTIGTWQGPQIASWQSTYNQTTGNDTLSRIDGILCSYYSIHCDFDSDGLADVVIEPEWTDPCQVGYYMNSEASCVIADIGYYGIGGWSDQIPADAGYYVDSSGASSQTPCPSGTYNPNTGSTNSSACINAIPGYYVESTGIGFTNRMCSWNLPTFYWSIQLPRC